MKKVGMNEILKGSERLNNYLQTIDEDLKSLQETFNKNTITLFEKLEELEKEIKKLK